jgi:hypothetical protein
MQHLPTFAGGPGRPPGAQTRGWLFMKNTIGLRTRMMFYTQNYAIRCYKLMFEQQGGNQHYTIPLHK